MGGIPDVDLLGCAPADFFLELSALIPWGKVRQLGGNVVAQSGVLTSLWVGGVCMAVCSCMCSCH